MAMTLRTLRKYLEQAGVTLLGPPDFDGIVAVFAADQDRNSYRGPDGSPLVRMVFQILDKGRFLLLSVPNAWNLSESPHKAAVFETLVTIQGRFPAVRFDYFPDDGDLWPNIEIPIEDSRITSRQLIRSISGLLQCLAIFDRVIYWAMTTGEASVANVTMDERWGEYENDDPKKTNAQRRPYRPAIDGGISRAWDANASAAEGNSPSSSPLEGDAASGPGLPDSTMATRLRTVLAIAQHEGGLDAVDRLLGRGEDTPSNN